MFPDPVSSSDRANTGQSHTKPRNCRRVVFCVSEPVTIILVDIIIIQAYKKAKQVMN